MLRRTGTPFIRASSSSSGGTSCPLVTKTQGRSKLKKVVERLAPLLRRQRAQVGDFRFAEHVETVGGEAAGISGQSEPRSRHLCAVSWPVQPQLAGQCLQLERVAPARQEIAEPKHQRALSVGAERALRGRSATRSSWRLSRSSARSSAVRWSGPSPRATSTSPRAQRGAGFPPSARARPNRIPPSIPWAATPDCPAAGPR